MLTWQVNIIAYNTAKHLVDSK